MKITKKTAIIGIAIIILIGIGSFFLEGAQSEDPSAGAKAETSAMSEGKADKETKSENKDKKSNATSEKSANSSSKNNSNSSNSSTPSQPAHIHSWTAVYFTNYKFVGEASICSTCGANITGQTASHAKQHNLNGENGGHYSEPIYEPYQELDYYKCSCGATK